MGVRARPAPPHDCRLTARCLREDFSPLTLGLDEDFEVLREQNSYIEAFFERRMNDPEGGEAGERIRRIRSRPAFSLHYMRLRGATWFETDNPPQGIVWLLGAGIHDERHKGGTDVYDILGALDDAGQLMPQTVDYDRLELDRRRADASVFPDIARAEADALVADCVRNSHAQGAVAGIPLRLSGSSDAGTTTLYGAVSRVPVPGVRSGLPFPLTEERFALVVETLRTAAANIGGTDVLTGETYTYPGGLAGSERAFLLVFAR